MLQQILLVVLAVLVTKHSPALADYNSDNSRTGHHYATSSPSTYSQESSYRATPAAEAKSYKEDDAPVHRPYGDARTGPPKKVGPGPGPLPYASPPLPLNYPHSPRILPAGSVIGYLAYPQPIQHEPYPHGLLPSAAYSHIAYAAPLAISPYHKPYSPGPGPAIPSYSSYSSSPHTNYHH